MVQIRQNEDEIKIIIELNRLITRKPDVVLLPTYLKFNTPPIFFERHLTQEIDEASSFCRIFKNEARIVLIKKQKGIWPEIFQKLGKEELLQRRLEISNQIVERNKERDQKVIERYELKRRNEIDKEVRREMAMRERVKQFEENACREALMVGGKETHARADANMSCSSAANGLSGLSRNNNNCSSSSNSAMSSARSHQSMGRVATPAAGVRNVGRINVSFSNFNMTTPKRESQEGRTMPFTIVNSNNSCANEPATPSSSSVETN